MSDHVPLRELIEAKLNPLADDVKEIIALQKEANSRLRKAETAIAILKAAYGVGLAVIGWLVVEMVRR